MYFSVKIIISFRKAIPVLLLVLSCQSPPSGIQSIPLADISLEEGFWQKLSLTFDPQFSLAVDSSLDLYPDELLPIQGSAGKLSHFYARFLQAPATGPIDWLERSLYNESLVQALQKKQPLPHPGHFMLAGLRDTLFVNLYLNARVKSNLNGEDFAFRLETDYPTAANIKITWEQVPEHELALALRLPGWAMNQPVPDSCYTYLHYSNRTLALKVNGELTHPDLWQGYAVLKKQWKAGEVVRLSLPMSVRRVQTLRADSLQNQIALEYGSLVYLADGAVSDNLAISGTKQYYTEEQPADIGSWQKISGFVWNGEAQSEMNWIPYFLQESGETKQKKIWFLRQD